ncbi:MAG: metal ABC transporter ATP-binding protein [Pseudomonadota bacterium]
MRVDILNPIKPANDAYHKNAFSVSDLTVAYDRKLVLWDISFAARAGVITAIVGPNGAGKSTLLKASLNLIPAVTGQTRLFNVPLSESRSKVAYMPQRAAVDWDFPASALDVVMMGLYADLGWLKWPGRKERAKARRCLEMVDMGAFADRQIGQLSGGQQQRVFMARALAQNADVYLMDEPFAGVDAATETVILRTLKRLANEGKCVIVVHHDLDTVRTMFDDVLLINKQVVAAGPIDEVMTEDAVRKTYSGRLSGRQLEPVGGAAVSRAI